MLPCYLDFKFVNNFVVVVCFTFESLVPVCTLGSKTLQNMLEATDHTEPSRQMTSTFLFLAREADRTAPERKRGDAEPAVRHPVEQDSDQNVPTCLKMETLQLGHGDPPLASFGGGEREEELTSLGSPPEV